jgi:hypothetical protein
MDMDFPSRKDILESRKRDRASASYLDAVVDQVKSIDIEKVDFENSDFKPRQRIVEKQRVYRWTRVFVKDEVADLVVNDVYNIMHLPTGEIMECQFICFAKKGLAKDSDGSIVSYDGEEDKKILCLMIDTDLLGKDSVRTISSLFPNTPYYEYNLMRRDELVFENKRTGERLDYFDVQF